MKAAARAELGWVDLLDQVRTGAVASQHVSEDRHQALELVETG
jgi:hypothetical protein